MPHSAEIAPLRTLDAEECARVAALVNEVYLATEGPMWRPGGTRTTPEEVAELVAAGQVHGVLDDEGPLGVVRVVVEGPRAELGMLAVRPSAGGRGLGTALVRHAEQHARSCGAQVMALEVVRPRDSTLPAKELLGAWYPRLGYTLHTTTPLAEVHPELLPWFVVPAVVDHYERPL